MPRGIFVETNGAVRYLSFAMMVFCPFVFTELLKDSLYTRSPKYAMQTSIQYVWAF